MGRPINVVKDFAEHRYLDSGYVVEVGSDVWIGSNVLISDGVRIGNGAVIGMGSVVTSDVLDFDIVAGVPARTIKSRFSQDVKLKLVNSRWWEGNLHDLDIDEVFSLLKP
jgi:acetyltransferase-like isoleucine patch superfamily enzyme